MVQLHSRQVQAASPSVEHSCDRQVQSEAPARHLNERSTAGSMLYNSFFRYRGEDQDAPVRLLITSSKMAVSASKNSEGMLAVLLPHIAE